MSAPAFLAPIAVFAYKRPTELRQTLQALKANPLAAQSDLFVFVDGPKRPEDEPKVAAVQSLVNELTGFRSITRRFAPTNQGLAHSIIQGVSEVIKAYGSVIVLEDDLITSPNFLDYMNQGLRHYAHNSRVFSIAGYSFPFKNPVNYQADGYFFPRTCSWGWATWEDRWNKADWLIADYANFIRDTAQRRAFNKGGSDRVRMLRRQHSGTLNSWAIRWCYTQFKEGGLTLYPVVSKIQNIGFTADSTHTNVFNRYKTNLDESGARSFVFPPELRPDPYFSQQFRRQFSLPVRFLNRLKTYAGLR